MVQCTRKLKCEMNKTGVKCTSIVVYYNRGHDSFAGATLARNLQVGGRWGMFISGHCTRKGWDIDETNQEGNTRLSINKSVVTDSDLSARPEGPHASQ